MKKAFTMIELVFVIVVIGILAGIAIPKFAATRDDANIVKGKSTVASIQSGLVTERTRRIMRGQSRYPTTLDDAANNTEDEELFDNVLERAIRSNHNAGGWKKDNNTTYQFYINSATTVQFDYNNTTGTFNCNSANANCSDFFIN